MSDIKRSILFGKLNPAAFKTLEAATAQCKNRGNPYVELAHWIYVMILEKHVDFTIAAEHFGCDKDRLAKDLERSIERLPRGATAVADFSPHLDESVEHAWTHASLVFGEMQIRTGHLLIGILRTPGLRNFLLGLSAEFGRIKVDVLSDEFVQIMACSKEATPENKPMMEGATTTHSATGTQEGLRRFTTDITEKARAGELDPVIGRDDEIRLCIDILMRRRQNNPVLTGEAGVGKTAVVEGLAQLIVSGKVPPALNAVSLLGLDIGLLQAGASMKGEFEQRLRSVIDEVQASPHPIILFIDEAHTLMGAGGNAGTGDAANLIKPALARGALRTIAATTWQEYKRHIEKDPALTRRFQMVKVEEPSEERCIEMMRNVAKNYESHHKVRILDEAVEAAVRYSHRYLSSRQLPDKAVSLLDTACARVALSQQSAPSGVADARRCIDNLNMELVVLRQEEEEGRDHSERCAIIMQRLQEARRRLDELEGKWKAERLVVNQLLALRNKVKPSKAMQANVAGNAGKLRRRKSDTSTKKVTALRKRLQKIQGDSPMIWEHVDRFAIADVVADWTGIPVGRMVRDDIERVLKLADILERRVLGQRAAIDTIARRIQTGRAKLENPNRPVGVFLLVGPSGTGKTETALALAEALYGGEQKMVTINMSEYQEAHTVSTLKGSPPGYVGYGEGGILTEAVRRQPYSVVLLDEVEKAHRDVHEIFFQVFDKGMMEDAEGRQIDFRNTLIILTSNVAQDVIFSLCKDPELTPEHDAIEGVLRSHLIKVFPDALLNRLVVVPYVPISHDILRRIIKLNLERVVSRLNMHHGVYMNCDEAAVALMMRRCEALDRGARIVESVITQELLPPIAKELLSRISSVDPMKKIQVSAEADAFHFSYT